MEKGFTCLLMAQKSIILKQKILKLYQHHYVYETFQMIDQ